MSWRVTFRGLVMGAGTDIRLRSLDGLFERSMDLNTPTLPRYHGGLVGTSWHRPRVLDLSLAVGGDIGGLREQLLDAFAPQVDSEFPLLVELPGRTWTVFCRPEQLQSRVDAAAEFAAKVDVQLVASDPALYGDPNLVVVPLFVASGGLTYPVSYPKVYGSGGGGEVTVTNGGAWETWPVIRITSPSTLTNPVVEFVSSNTRLDLSGNGGTVVSAGQTLLIDTHPARRSVAFASGASRYGNLTEDSVWSALQPGDTQVRLRGTGEGSAEVEWRDAWI